MKTQVEIFTDGSCRGNPGPGGWGVLWRYQGEKTTEKELYGGEYATTNNRMELTAAIIGLEALKRPCNVILWTDSKYVMEGMIHWIEDWKKRAWKTAAKKPVKNEDLWRRLDQACAQHEITWQWVKGHSGHLENERVDTLAKKGVDELPLENSESAF